ncbi:MAG: biopolymer transporter ExbD [Bdellovibrionota bacterium]
MRAGMFGKRRRGDQDFPLQITSLIDTLVIILVFMLMTVGSGSINLEPASNIILPWSSQGAELTQGVKLIAKTNGIYIDQELIVPLQNAVTPGGTTSENGKKIVHLFTKLATIARDSKSAAEKSGVKFEGKILFQADKSIPLKTVKQVLYTAARAGFNDFKFAVIRQ